jgi:hypothetical protein
VNARTLARWRFAAITTPRSLRADAPDRARSRRRPPRGPAARLAERARRRRRQRAEPAQGGHDIRDGVAAEPLEQPARDLVGLDRTRELGSGGPPEGGLDEVVSPPTSGCSRRTNSCLSCPKREPLCQANSTIWIAIDAHRFQ